MQIIKLGSCSKVLYYLFFLVLLNACQLQMESEEQTALCVWAKGSVRSAPSQDSAWLSSLYLGQQVVYTGTTAMDSTDKNHLYFHVRLSDGTEGWVSEFVVVPHARPAVVHHACDLYSLPDTTAMVVKQMNDRDFVAIDEVKDRWVHVVTSRMANKGWIVRNDLSEDTSEVGEAIATQQIWDKRDSLKQLECINKIKKDLSLRGSDLKAVSHSNPTGP